MQNPYKKPYKGFYSKAKTQGLSNYEYDSFEGPSYQNHYYNKHGNPYKYSKPKKYYPEYTYQPVKNPSSQPQNHSEEGVNTHSKGLEHDDRNLHEKIVEAPKGQVSSPEAPLNKEVSKPRGKGDKKPEKPLYSARRKYAKGADSGKGDNNMAASTEASGQSQDSTLSEEKGTTNMSITDRSEKKREMDNTQRHEQNHEKSAEKGGRRGEKERLSSEEDKSFVSNVSTAISDKAKTCEDETNGKEKVSAPETKKKGKKASGKILVQIMLESENCMEKVRIFEDEEDYEAMLDKVCKNHNFRGSAGLYFKINMLRMIHDMHYDKSRVEPALRKNIALNSKLFLCENGLQEPDDSIRPYLSSNNGPFY